MKINSSEAFHYEKKKIHLAALFFQSEENVPCVVNIKRGYKIHMITAIFQCKFVRIKWDHSGNVKKISFSTQSLLNKCKNEKKDMVNNTPKPAISNQFCVP